MWFDVALFDSCRWDKFHKEYDLKWDSCTANGLALTIIGMGLSPPTTPPPEGWQQSFISAVKSRFSKPQSWSELVQSLRVAASMDAGEEFPQSLWVSNLLNDLGVSWGLQRPVTGGLWHACGLDRELLQG